MVLLESPACKQSFGMRGDGRAGDGCFQAIASSRIISAPFSPIIIVGALVLPVVNVGITEASTTRSPACPVYSPKSSCQRHGQPWTHVADANGNDPSTTLVYSLNERWFTRSTNDPSTTTTDYYHPEQLK